MTNIAHDVGSAGRDRPAGVSTLLSKKEVLDSVSKVIEEQCDVGPLTARLAAEVVLDVHRGRFV